MDINSLPSNSHKSKEQQYSKPEKKIEPVVSGKATVKKKSGIVRLADVFLPEDVESVKDYVIGDIIIPKIRSLLHDIGSEAWDSFWGISGRGASRGTASKVSYVSYDKYSRDKQPETPRRSGVNYEEIVFPTRGDAESVFDRMAEVCDTFNAVSVADMYELADVPNDNYTLNKYGWTSMEGAQVIRLSGGGFSIKMPKARPFD